MIDEDDLVYVGHVHTTGQTSTYGGWLVAETKRHAPELGELTDEEARAIGSITTRAACVLRDVAGAKHVYSFVFGDGVPHFHVHARTYHQTDRAYLYDDLITRAQEASP